MSNIENCDTISVSSHSSLFTLAKKIQKREKLSTEPSDNCDPLTIDEHNFDTKSQVSDAITCWQDFEEVSVCGEPGIRFSMPNMPETKYENNPIPEDDDCTQEQIDFDDLTVLSIEKKKTSKSAKSVSSLSRSSKKISKSKISIDDCSPKKKKKKAQRKIWQESEDQKVLDLVQKYGERWALISSLMEGRTEKQIRERYLNKLKPNIKSSPWSQEEDDTLYKLYRSMGNKWSKIATFLPGRTERQVKNRFHWHIKLKVLDKENAKDRQVHFADTIESSPSTKDSETKTEDPMDMISYGDDVESWFEEAARDVKGSTKKFELNLIKIV